MKSDIWSLGCVLYECTTLKPPFLADDMSGLYKKVLKGMYPKIPTQFSNDLSNMLRMLLQISPICRPTCGICLNRKNFEDPDSEKKNGNNIPRGGSIE
jgi:serine/threonine protein kinase